LRSFLRHARFKKTPHLYSRIFNLVKYTKTLSVRNQHDRYSPAFFQLMLANSHTHRDSAGPLASSRSRCARSIAFGKALAAPRGKTAHQSAPYAAWVSAMSPAPPRNPHHPFPNSRALARRSRTVAAHCF
jgi:hypothetical protein